jgi:hypothetical protein
MMLDNAFSVLLLWVRPSLKKTLDWAWASSMPRRNINIIVSLLPAPKR